ncbi:DUF1819 family protein [Cloacibacillus evryensis]|uniref:DUF1819 family protein n=1 Tax=Cloacibacillus evryensis TaxID=508460 RepID=UPI0004AE7456|nr:DUF1819 family protein [Cloacibacillus evryensis]
MREETYSAGMVSKPFWYLEFNTAAQLAAEGCGWDEIKRRALCENLFGAAKLYRAKEIFNAVSRRVQTLDGVLLALFCESGLPVKKTLALCAVMRTDRLFFEFVNEVYRGKLELGEAKLRDVYINAFFTQKAEQGEPVASWTDYTLKKLANSYKNVLLEAGALRRGSDGYILTPPVLAEPARALFRQHGMGPCVAALTGAK